MGEICTLYLLKLIKRIPLWKFFGFDFFIGTRNIFLRNDEIGSLIFLSNHRTFVSGFVYFLSLLPQLVNQFIHFLSCVWPKCIFNRRDILVLFSFDLHKLHFFFFGISHFAGLFFLFFQNGCIFVCCFLSFSYGFIDFLVDDVQLVVFVNLLKFLLVLLQFEFCSSFLFGLILENIRCDSCIHLDSLGSLLLIFLCQSNDRILMNKFHKTIIISL